MIHYNLLYNSLLFTLLFGTKSEEKYGRNIVKQVLEPVNTTRKGRALFERSEFCSTPRSIYRLCTCET